MLRRVRALTAPLAPFCHSRRRRMWRTHTASFALPFSLVLCRSQLVRRPSTGPLTPTDYPPGSYVLGAGALRDLRIFKLAATCERIMFKTLTSDQIFEALSGAWQALGIVSALLGALAFEAVQNPVKASDPSGWANSLYGACTTFAILLELGSALFCTLLFMGLNSGPRANARAFLDYFLLLLPVPIMMMLGGVTLLAVATWLVTREHYPNSTVGWPIIIFTGMGALMCLLLLGYIVHGSTLVHASGEGEGDKYAVQATDLAKKMYGSGAGGVGTSGGGASAAKPWKFCGDCGNATAGRAFCTQCGMSLISPLDLAPLSREQAANALVATAEGVGGV